jgi:hypothetical protein
LPPPKFTRHGFPKGSVFAGDSDRPYEVQGWVRTKVNYTSLDPGHEEDDLCRNAYNKAANDLLERAKKNGADAVIDMKSVVFLEDGRRETYSTPECADDGQEGQILAQGIAVKWKVAQSADLLKPAAKQLSQPPAAVLVPQVPAPESENQVGKRYSATESDSGGVPLKPLSQEGKPEQKKVELLQEKSPVLVEDLESKVESKTKNKAENKTDWPKPPQLVSPETVVNVPVASPFRPVIRR